MPLAPQEMHISHENYANFGGFFPKEKNSIDLHYILHSGLGLASISVKIFSI